MNKLLSSFSIVLISFSFLSAQTRLEKDTVLINASLQNCIDYAVAHQPLFQKSLINEQVVNQEIKSKLSDWYPQLDFNFNLQHNFQLPVTVFQGRVIHLGYTNNSSAQFSVTQNIFNKDVLLASSTASDVNKQASQSTEENKINLIVNVTKAYYSVLLVQNQIDLVNEDIARLKQSVNDSYIQYKDGVVDKTDYMQATISLNNAKAEQKQSQEQLKVSYANLKQLMGYPPAEEISLNYDLDKMENDINIDTTETLKYQHRIEYKLLQTQRRLQKANLDYYIWSFIPSLSAFGEYNMNFQNDQFSDLYAQKYPSSYVGLQLSFPIFEGGKRIHQIEQAKLEMKIIDSDQSALENSISTEYIQALANYKSNLNEFRIQKNNLDMAKEVYNIIELQYKSGIKTYLDVITAETNLRSTQVNYLNALYQVLISKTDLQKALGTIKF
jgi:outer membrane protein